MEDFETEDVEMMCARMEDGSSVEEYLARNDRPAPVLFPAHGIDTSKINKNVHIGTLSNGKKFTCTRAELEKNRKKPPFHDRPTEEKYRKLNAQRTFAIRKMLLEKYPDWYKDIITDIPQTTCE